MAAHRREYEVGRAIIVDEVEPTRDSDCHRAARCHNLSLVLQIVASEQWLRDNFTRVVPSGLRGQVQLRSSGPYELQGRVRLLPCEARYEQLRGDPHLTRPAREKGRKPCVGTCLNHS